MSTHFHKILQLCERHLFVIPVVSTSNGRSLITHFKYGPSGEILKNNVLQEWLYSNVINTDGNIFPYNSGAVETGILNQDISEPYKYIKNICSGQLPFGIAEIKTQTVNKTIESLNVSNDCDKEELYFYPQNHKQLRCRVFARPANSTQFFDHWQQQKLIWWQKFSASPERFCLTDNKSTEEGQVVEIQVNFPWGRQIVETIKHRTATSFESLDNDSQRILFEARDGRKKVFPHVVESWASLECAVLTFLCDAYDETVFLGLPRNVMRFHCRLAPYKSSFSASPSSASLGEELGQLSTYLTKQFRKSGILTLLLPDLAKKSLESQFARNDEMGIPYTIVLNDTTLKNGIIGLRSRDTTLKEEVNVSELKNYMELLLKSY